MIRAADPERDQSHFLFATTRAQLGFLRFPLGDLRKDETRRLAAELGLAIADKPDSQDICFVPTGRYSQVVERLHPQAAQPGEIVHVDGRVLGRHDGIIHYTIGQRRGLGIAQGEPLFVVRLDSATARVIVGPREALLTHVLALRDVNWLGEGELADLPEGGIEVWARVRSSQPPQPATLFTVTGETFVRLHQGENGVAAGQACVFYNSADPRARVLGGGWIRRATRD
jgi:tRNA-uridine 2-sulfurtransferase